MQNKDFEGPVAFGDHKLRTQLQRRGERQGVSGCAVKSSCLTKGKGRDSAPPQRGPKNPTPQKRPYKDRNLKGQNSKQPICCSRNAITTNQISKPKPNRAQTKQDNLFGRLVSEYAGWRGPCPGVLRCRGGDRDTGGANDSSRPGNRPTHTSIPRIRKRKEPQKQDGPALSRLLCFTNRQYRQGPDKTDLQLSK